MQPARATCRLARRPLAAPCVLRVFSHEPCPRLPVFADARLPLLLACGSPAARAPQAALREREARVAAREKAAEEREAALWRVSEQREQESSKRKDDLDLREKELQAGQANLLTALGDEQAKTRELSDKLEEANQQLVARAEEVDKLEDKIQQLSAAEEEARNESEEARKEIADLKTKVLQLHRATKRPHADQAGASGRPAEEAATEGVQAMMGAASSPLPPASDARVRLEPATPAAAAGVFSAGCSAGCSTPTAALSRASLQPVGYPVPTFAPSSAARRSGWTASAARSLRLNAPSGGGEALDGLLSPQRVAASPAFGAARPVVASTFGIPDQ